MGLERKPPVYIVRKKWYFQRGVFFLLIMQQ